MPVLRPLVRRLRGDDLAAIRNDVAAIRTQMSELSGVLSHLGDVVGRLNHDVRSGAEEGLPLFLGYAERFRTDAETAIGATVIIDRQLRRITEQVDRLTGPADVDG